MFKNRNFVRTLFLGMALCALIVSCSKKQEQAAMPAGDQASAPAKLPDEAITQSLPAEGTPEYDALKKQYLEQRFTAVQQKQAGEASAGQPAAGADTTTAAPTPEQQAVAAEVGQDGNAGKAQAQSAAPTAGQPPLEAGVTPGTTAGSVRRVEIPSDFRCSSEADCTSTKYANAPIKKDDCTCQAGCTPFVVNKAEKDRREASNKSLCDNSDWFGDACPAPACGFIEFDTFKCVEGKCVGWALGE
jgi:hypothetical protein